MSALSRDRGPDTARKLAAAWAAARIAYDLGVVVAPKPLAGPWLGDGLERGGGRVGAKGLVLRDALVAIGVGAAALRGAPVRPWLAVGVASDAADIALTLSERDELPEGSALGTVALAGAVGLAGAALLAAVDE